MIVDLRSDTLTQPTPAMRGAMMRAPVGDDVFGEDPSVKSLEQKCVDLFGMGAAVFCPSGTMTNQIGIGILTQPYEEVLCYSGAHIYKHEGGGIAGNSHLSIRVLEGDRGRISREEIEANINNAADPHQAISSLVALENTVVRGGGSMYSMEKIAEISAFARSKGMKMHLDGARLFNAIVETGDKPSEFGKHFDTISVCLSKGLGAPVGSVLLCKKELEVRARRKRKAFGGGMRQAGFIAAAGSYALDHHVGRLKEDHRRAKALGETLKSLPWVKRLLPVDTNIILITLEERLTPESVLQKMAGEELKAVKFGAKEIRMVTHLDIDDSMIDRAIEVLRKLHFN